MNDSKRKLLPALAALGGSLATGQAAALEIGQVNVESTLGEPLRASIAYALGPNEQLAEYCISLNPASPGSALPSISRATVSVDKGLITITGSTVLKEPLATLRLDVRCPYTPRFSREYMLMIDPGGSLPSVAAAPATRPSRAATAATSMTDDDGRQAARPPVAGNSRETTGSPPAISPPPTLFAGDRIFVEPGQTLSRIVAAVADAPADFAEAAGRIVAANPAAFVDGDPNRLEAGNWLTIPDFETRTADFVETAPQPARYDVPASAPGEVSTPVESDASATEPGTTVTELRRSAASSAADTAPATSAAVITPPPAESLEAEPAPALQPNAGLIDDTDFLEPASPSSMTDLESADAASGSEAPRPVTAGATTVPDAPAQQASGDIRVVPGTEITAAPAARTAPRDRVGTSASSTFWFWLIGGGVAAIAGLLALLRRGRADEPAADLREKRRQSPLLERVQQADAIQVEPIQPFTEPDFSLGDDSPTAENPVLDPSQATGIDDDGALEADLASDSDHHAHQNVDMNLADVRYDDDVDLNLSADVGDDRDGSVDLDLSSGSGLQTGEHGRADQDFAFAATTALDFELPDDADPAPEQPGTDVIPPLNIEESSILKGEVLPEDDDDDYDMSVIVDATKQPDPSEVTEKDLQAVVVDAGDETVSADDYTVAQEPDFELLEKDYEDELSATQALNMEIERAAEELAGRIDAGDDASSEVTGPDGGEQSDGTAALGDDAPTEVASLDDETVETAAAADEEPPTAIAPLDDDADDQLTQEMETDVASFDDETIDAAVAALTDEEPPTAIAPLDDDADDQLTQEMATDVAPLTSDTIEAQLAHLPGERSAGAANDDPVDETILDDNDATGINAAFEADLSEEDKTVEMSRDEDEPTIRISGDDDTVEMPPRSKKA